MCSTGLVGKTGQPPVLVTHGLYKYVRHPLYVGIFLLAWPLSEMTVNRLALILIFTAYTFIGATFEERKLLKDFGETYAYYRTQTPMYIPNLRKIGNR